MAIPICRWQCPNEWSEWSRWLATGLHARNRWRLPVLLVGILFAQGRRTVTTWLRAAGVSDDLGRWLGVNEYQGETFVDRKQLETLLYWWQVLALLPELGDDQAGASEARALRAAELLELAEAAGWKLEGLQ